MKTILVLGAGRSSSSLIQYLLHNAPVYGWKVVVGDVSEKAAREKIGHNPAGAFTPFDINHVVSSAQSIGSADVVISLLPAFLHPQVAKICLDQGKHLLTASYVSTDIQLMHEKAKSAGLLFLNECGLDPGIDHMTAMQIINRIKQKGGQIESFESLTGGLIAPRTDPENPWRYKFTWNPRNVVMAGQSTAKYLENGKLKYIPYHQLFSRTTRVEVPGFGVFEGYANRDSLQYIDTYALQNINTMLRGTLRYEGFCSAWNILVQLGCCDDSFIVDALENRSQADFFESFLPSGPGTIRKRVASLFNLDDNDEALDKLEWSGFFSDDLIGLEKGSPAQVVEHILSKRWTLKPDDLDLIVMWHRFTYRIGNELKETRASLTCTGESATHTAMARTVGLPLAIAAKLLLTEKLSRRGVQIPTLPEIYEPILAELDSLGIRMSEQEF
jgi:saccharopine dehydrogenase-like NADP-dependent oxidoreductase